MPTPINVHTINVHTEITPDALQAVATQLREAVHQAVINGITDALHDIAHSGQLRASTGTPQDLDIDTHTRDEASQEQIERVLSGGLFPRSHPKLPNAGA